MQHRFSSRVVSIVHMVWVLCETFGALSDVLRIDEPGLKKAAYSAVIFGMLLLSILNCFQLYGAYKLFNGTRNDVSTHDALIFCRTWRRITLATIGCLTLGILILVFQGRVSVSEFVLFVVDVTLLFLAVWCVKRYTNQLESSKKKNKNLYKRE